MLVVVIATITLVALLQLAPARRPLVLPSTCWSAAVAVQPLVTWLLYPRPPASPFDAAPTARPPPRPPAELDRLARLLALSSASAACPYPTAVERPGGR